MSRKRPSAKTDPKLLRQIEDADGPVEVICTLKPADPAQPGVPPDQAEPLTYEVLDRVREQTGLGARDVNVFRNLGSFVVSAEGPFLKALLAQPEIASATANRQGQPLLIGPRKVKPA